MRSKLVGTGLIGLLACGADAAQDDATNILPNGPLPQWSAQLESQFCGQQKPQVYGAIDEQTLIEVNCLVAVPSSASTSECASSVAECLAAGGDGDLETTREAAASLIAFYASPLGSICQGEEPFADCEVSATDVDQCLVEAIEVVRSRFVPFNCNQPRGTRALLPLTGLPGDNFYTAPPSCSRLENACNPFRG